MRAFFRALRIVSAITLFFFLWTYLSLFQVAAWAASSPATGGRGEAATGSGSRRLQPAQQRPEERFEKALEDIREKVGGASEKHAKGEDDSAEIEAIKAKKTELESLNLDIRKSFAETERKLKDAKLPQIILDRHIAFVKNYENNLVQLKTEIDDIEKAKTKADRKAKIEKARLHLEKTRKPSRHEKFDPGKPLPHRNRVLRTKWREPRTTPEQFRKDFPPQNKKKNSLTAENAENAEKYLGLRLTALSPQSTQSAQRTAQWIPDAGYTIQDVRTYASWNMDRESVQFGRELARIFTNGFEKKANGQKPILLAYNGSIDDLSLFNPESETRNSLIDLPSSVISVADSFTPQSEIRIPHLGTLLATSYEPSAILLAQAMPDLPTADDLAETPEVQFTPDIRAKAQELGNNPVRIYNWVRNNIIYEPYYGSFKGAQQTLLEGAGNDFDQASLLISLMRVCNIASKFAYGTVEIPAEKVANMVGVADPTSAATILATQGIPVKLVISGGTVKALRLERAWVESWIDYFPSWGARHKPGGEDTWIPLDPAFKQYTYKQGMDMYAEMGFNAEDFLMSYITDTRDITAYQDYGKRLVDFIDTNYPDATIEQVFGASEIKATKTIIKQEFPYLLGTLPYKTIVKAAEFSQVPPTKDYVITIQIEGNSLDGALGLNYTGYLNYLADKRVTVSYDPATSADEALMAQYGGNILAVPPYLLSVKPVLKIAGSTVATGASIGLGQDQNIVISFAGPDGDTDRIQNVITAGDYSAIIMQSQKTPSQTTEQILTTLTININNINSPGITFDDLLGQLLYSIGISYFQRISFENEVYAKSMNLLNLRQPGEAIVTHGVKVDYLFGLPRSIAEGGIKIDVDRNINVVVSKTQDSSERTKAFMILSGLSSSAWENRILEAFFDGTAVSTVRLLKLASAQGISLHTITNANLNSVLPLLQVSSEVKSDISNAVNAGKEVIISQANVSDNQWQGVGFIVLNPATGAAGYMISGGLAGGDTSLLISLRRLPEWVAYDYWRTFWIRGRALRIARAYKDTPYVYGGCDRNGMDCSGLLREVYPEVNGEGDYGGARNIYNDCERKNWLRPSNYRFPGEIIWNAGLSHTGIEAGINTITWPPNTRRTVTDETVVHASGRPCYRSVEEAPEGTPARCIISSCIPVDPDNPELGGNPSCSRYNLVLESPLSFFLYQSSLHSNCCSPR